MKHQAMHSRAASPRAYTKSSTRPSGFTLVEILVVLAIIAILTSILFPVFRQVQENGRSAACQSNLKQLGMAFAQYARDYNDRLPGGGNYQAWGNGGHWVAGVNGEDGKLAKLGATDKADEYPYIAGRKADIEKGALFSYVKTPEVYVCPSNEDGEAKRLTYSMNCAISGGPVSRVRFPSSMVLLVDEWKASDAYFWAADNPASTDTITKDHNASGNLLFLDGHAKNYTNSNFPLDDSGPATTAGTGLANKIAGSKRGNEPASTSTPRFRDVTLGPEGAYSPNPFYSTPGTVKDACTPVA